MNFKKLISVLLLLCMVSVMMLTACDKDEDTSKDALTGATGTGEYQDADGNYVGSTSGNNYEGETITFLTCGVNPTYESEILCNTYEDDTEETLPQIINDDLKLRADLLEEKLGVVIEETKIYDLARKNAEMCRTIREGNMTSTEDYQVVVPCLYDGATLAVEGQLHNLLGLDGFQIEAPWWNQQFNEEMTYANQLYFAIGDIGLVNKSSTAALYFNLELWNKYNLSDTYGGNPYELVREGKWTVDVAFEAAHVHSADLNNDGQINYEDEYGWSGQLDDMWYIFFGSGERIASADADGYPTITMYNERSAKVIEALQEFLQNKEYHVSANDYFGVVQWPAELTREAFITGRALFFNDAVGTVVNLGAMEQHFGLVPEPKFEESQESYYSLVNPWGSTCFAIPISVVGDKLTMTIDVLNVLGADSKNTVAKDYQETVLSYMKTRDDDSADMINNYILPSRACDIGMVYQWGQLDILLQDMAKENVGTFASNFEAKKSAAESALETTVEFYKDNEK